MSTRPPARRRSPIPGLVAGLVAGLVVLPLTFNGVEAQVAPDDPWRVTQTEHFRITFPAGLEALAERTGVRAEAAYADLTQRLAPLAPGQVDIVLTDHLDASNGFAGMSPWRRIVIYARPPTDVNGLQYFDEWIELVVIHELTHIIHLDAQGTLARITRTLFGRPPASWPFYPNAAVPKWTTEGLATLYESSLTEAGRGKGTDHEMVLRTAALAGTLDDLGQAGGDSPRWPGGNRYYIYGSRFLIDLVAREGEEGMPAFVEAIADQWIPLRINSASREAFESSFSEAWRGWSSRIERHAAETAQGLTRTAPITAPLPLDEGGWEQSYPRIWNNGIIFARSDRKTDAQIRLWVPYTGPEQASNTTAGHTEKLIRTNGLATLDAAKDGSIVFAQLEFRDPYRLRSDLYQWTPAGETRRITTEARLSHPSLSPDGKRAVAVQEGTGTNRLVIVELESGDIQTVTDFDPEVHWTMPAWSPTEDRIAVARWVPGDLWDLGLLDLGTGMWSPITSDRALDMAPAWTPDGKTVLWASDRTGIPNIFASEGVGGGNWGPVMQVTNMVTGAGTPTTDGEWIYLSTYGSGGWRISRMPLDMGTWFEPQPTDPRFQIEPRRPPPIPDPDSPPSEIDPQTRSTGQERSDEKVRNYRAFRSMLPRYWAPTYSPGEANSGTTLLGWGMGAYTGGQDLVGRHYWVAAALWRPDGGQTDWSLSYSFSGLGTPILGASAFQGWDASGPFALPTETDTIPVSIEERERSAGLSVSLPRVRVRTFSALRASASIVRSEAQVREIGGGLLPSDLLRRPDQTLGQIALTGSFANHRTHPFSVSREDGVSLEVRGRIRQDFTVADSLQNLVGWDGSFDDITARVAGYWAFEGPGYASHVLAARVSGGHAGGPGADAFHFDLGGAAGQALPGFGGLGASRILFPLRGYASGVRSGTHAVSGSAEYRFPLGLLNQGFGAFPLYLDRLMGDLFVDMGNAWGPNLETPGYNNPKRSWLASVGAEIRMSLTPLWTRGLDLRAGLAFPLIEGDGPGFYIRLGPSF